MKTFCVLLAAAAAVLFVRHLTAANVTTQEFTPARYALLEASVNVSSVLNSGGFDRGVQKTVLKIDIYCKPGFARGVKNCLRSFRFLCKLF